MERISPRQCRIGRRGDVVSRCLEDVYDAGDDDERASARDWSLAKLKDEKAVAKHFVAISTNAKRSLRSSASILRICSVSGTGLRGSLLDGLAIGLQR